jgi:cysteine-rich repeat protein
MSIKTSSFFVAFVVVTASACAISTRKEDDRQRDEDVGASRSSDADHDNGASNSDTDSGVSVNRSPDANRDNGNTIVDTGSISTADVCGNGIVEGGEECDDGDFDSRNGCSPLCRFSCMDDSDCDDGNDCNGRETCGTVENNHACNNDVPPLNDGEPCGEDGVDSSCWYGICVPNVCGDGQVTGNEQCDDGNLDPNDGCTPDCEWSCANDEDCVDYDECLGIRTCENRVCSGGVRLDDEIECTIVDTQTKSFCGNSDSEKDGWCMKGVCTCTGCGNGTTDGDEECDDGEKNGTEDSPNHCSIDCRVVECGDGVVEGDEECDDGNHQRLDGCDPNCEYEFAHRMTSVQILRNIKVPDWCVHRANRFGEAFAESVNVMGMSPNLSEIYNGYLTGPITSGQNNLLFHIIDSYDTSMRTVDDQITIGAYQAVPLDDSKWDASNLLDVPVLIRSSYVNADTGQPAPYHSIPALQAGGGRTISREPVVFEMQSGFGTGVLRITDFMMELVFDIRTLSKPNISISNDLKVSNDLRLPEVSGKDPTGIICGAIGPESLNRAAYTETSGPGGPAGGLRCCKNRGADAGSTYRACQDGVLTDQCDSFADLIRQGCAVCFYSPDPSSILQMDNSCELMQSDPASCQTIISGVDFDVDTDGDGVNDAWSVMFGFDAERIRISGLADK